MMTSANHRVKWPRTTKDQGLRCHRAADFWPLDFRPLPGSLDKVLIRLVLAVVSLGGFLAAPGPAHAGRVPCSQVIAEMDRTTSSAADYEGADPIKVGRRLGVEPLWVERCAATYGRRLSRKAPGVGVSPEALIERWESQEPEELASEEIEAKGDIPQEPLEDIDKRPKSIPDSAHQWSPDIGHTWSPSMPPIWAPVIHDNDLGVTP